MIGQRLAHYTIIESLGAGGMGEVYLAQDERLGREVAIKVLPKDFASDVKRVARFHREAKLASALSHANIATIYEAGEEDGQHYIAMELVKGETLTARVKPGGLKLDEILDVAVPLAEGLAEAHEAGVVHRDLKPGNVMIDQKRRVKILDFGLSRPVPMSDVVTAGLTSSGTVMGTPHYMAPEQMRGEETDARSDLFSLGVILYELATGSRPFEGDSLAMVMNSVINSEPTPLVQARPNLGELFGHTVERLLAKDPAQRFQTASGVAAELRSLRRPTTSVSLRRQRRSPGLRLVAGGALLMTIAVLAWTHFAHEEDTTPVDVPAAPARPTLAIVPIAHPGDDESASLARNLTYLLPEVLEHPEFELLSASYLGDRAKERGIAMGDLTSAVGQEIAREAGATWLLVTILERGPEGLDLHAELQDPASGRLRAVKTVFGVEPAAVQRCAQALAAAILPELGVEVARMPAAAPPSDSAEAIDDWTRGRLAYDRGDWEEACQRFALAVKADPEFALAHYDLARAISWSEPTKEALPHFERALACQGRLSSTDREKLALRHLLLGILTDVQGPGSFVPGTMERARALAEANPRDKDALDVWMELAWGHPVDGSPAETIRASRRLLELDPDYTPALIGLENGGVLLDDEDLVREGAEGVVRVATDSEDAVISLLRLGRKTEARAKAEEMGRDAQTWARRLLPIRAALALEDYELALQLASLGWGKDRNAFKYQRIQALIALGRLEEARVLIGYNTSWYLRVELGLFQGVTDESKDSVRIGRAVQLARCGRPDAARIELERISSSALSAHWLRRLHQWAEGEIASAERKPTEALKHFLEAAPGVGEAEDYWVWNWSGTLVQRAGQALREAGEYDEAESYLRRFEEEELGDEPLIETLALYDLALCRQARGDEDGALLYLERFLTRWSTPTWGFPQIEHGLALYEELTGKPWPVSSSEIRTRSELIAELEQVGREPMDRSDTELAIEGAMCLDDLKLATELAAEGGYQWHWLDAIIGLGRVEEARAYTRDGYHRFELGIIPPGPDADVLRLLRVGALARAGRVDQAEEELDEIPAAALAHAPEANLFNWARAWIAAARGDDRLSLERFVAAAPRRAGEIHDRWSAFLVQQAGRALRENGRIQEAERWLRRFELDLYFPIPRTRAWYDLAVCRNELGDTEAALEYLTRFLSRWSTPADGFPEIEEALALYETLSGNAWTVLFHSIDPVVFLRGRDPETYDEHVLAIEGAFLHEEYERALEIASRGWKGKASFNLQRLSALIALGRFAEARSQVGDASAGSFPYHRTELGLQLSNPDNHTKKLARAAFVAREGHTEEAEKLLAGADRESELPLVRWVEAEIALARGEVRAPDLFVAAAETEGEIGAEWRGFLLQRAGRELRRAERCDEAEDLLHRLDVLAAPVPRIRAEYDLARCLEGRGDVDGALVHLERFLTCWSEPDWAFPEIEEALFMYEVLTGKAWGR